MFFLMIALSLFSVFLLAMFYIRNKELSHYNEYLRSIFHGSVRACFVVNENDRIIYVNLAMLQLLGKKEENLMNALWYEKLVPHDMDKYRAINKENTQEHFFINLRELDDNERPYKVTRTRVGEYTLCELQDISCYEEQKAKFDELEKENQHLKKALEIQELKFKKTFDMSINGIVILNGKGETTYTNKAIQTMLDYNESYLEQLGLKPLFSDSESLPTLLKMAKNDKAVENLPHHFQNRSGISLDITISMSYLAELDQFLIIIQDITKELEYTRKLEKQKESYARRADMDVLTPCFSRSYLDTLLQNLCEAKKEFIYIMFDIDHFKSVNDTYGHQVGDDVLIKVVSIMKNELRSADVLARYGGEEFAIVLENTSAKDAFDIAEKLRKVVEKSDFFPLPMLTCSFGVSCNSSLLSCKQMVECADKALYKAKTNGRNRVETFEEVQELI